MHKVELKSLYFSLVYVFLFSSKTRIYQQNIHKGEPKVITMGDVMDSALMHINDLPIPISLPIHRRG